MIVLPYFYRRKENQLHCWIQEGHQQYLLIFTCLQMCWDDYLMMLIQISCLQFKSIPRISLYPLLLCTTRCYVLLLQHKYLQDLQMHRQLFPNNVGLNQIQYLQEQIHSRYHSFYLRLVCHYTAIEWKTNNLLWCPFLSLQDPSRSLSFLLTLNVHCQEYSDLQMFL